MLTVVVGKSVEKGPFIRLYEVCVRL